MEEVTTKFQKLTQEIYNSTTENNESNVDFNDVDFEEVENK